MTTVQNRDASPHTRSDERILKTFSTRLQRLEKTGILSRSQCSFVERDNNIGLAIAKKFEKKSDSELTSEIRWFVNEQRRHNLRLQLRGYAKTDIPYTYFT